MCLKVASKIHRRAITRSPECANNATPRARVLKIVYIRAASVAHKAAVIVGCTECARPNAHDELRWWLETYIVNLCLTDSNLYSPRRRGRREEKARQLMPD